MPRHPQNKTDSVAYTQYGRYTMNEIEFNLRAYGKKTIEDKEPLKNLCHQRPHILARVRGVMVGGHPVSQIASIAGVKRQAVYLNIYKFLVMTEPSKKKTIGPSQK